MSLDGGSAARIHGDRRHVGGGRPRLCPERPRAIRNLESAPGRRETWATWAKDVNRVLVRGPSGIHRGLPTRRRRCDVLNVDTVTTDPAPGEESFERPAADDPVDRSRRHPPMTALTSAYVRGSCTGIAQPRSHSASDSGASAGPGNHVAGGREARSVIRAIPCALGGVPAHRASHMRADRRTERDRSS
jgi:hypothetical protein